MPLIISLIIHSFAKKIDLRRTIYFISPIINNIYHTQITTILIDYSKLGDKLILLLMPHTNYKFSKYLANYFFCIDVFDTHKHIITLIFLEEY